MSMMMEAVSRIFTHSASGLSHPAHGLEMKFRRYCLRLSGLGLLARVASQCAN